MSKRRFRRAERDGLIYQRTAAWDCLYCGHTNDALALFGSRQAPKPNPGDALMCIKCAQIMLVDDLLNPRKPDPAELMAMRMADPAFAQALDRVKFVHRKAFPRS